VADVTITASGGYTAKTTSDGTYRLTNIPAGTYTLTPTLANATFTPTTRSVVVTNADSTGQDFTATKVTYTISGMVKDEDDQGVADVTITASGGYTAKTTSDGTYRLTNIPAGTYTLTLTLANATFTPATRFVEVKTTSIDEYTDFIMMEQPAETTRLVFLPYISRK
jgi:hypothetical protein